MEDQNLSYRSPEPGHNNKKTVSLIIAAVLIVVLLITLVLVFKPAEKLPERPGLSQEELEVLNKTGTDLENTSLLTEEESAELLENATTNDGSLLTEEELKELSENGSVKP